MKKKFLRTFITMMLAVVAVFGFCVSAHAIDGELSGESLLYQFYDLRSQAAGGLGLTDNYFTVTNTSTDAWVQAHVRVRTGHDSIELLDFDVLLSPADVFTFDLYDDNGATVFASCDTKTLTNSGFTLNFDKNGDGTNDCYILDSTTFPAMLSLIETCEGSTPEVALANTKKGYVEVIGEGAILSNAWYKADGYTTSNNKNTCPGNAPGSFDSDDDVSIAGKMLDHTNSDFRLCDTTDGDGLCDDACVELSNQLIGRVYYGTVDNAGSVPVVVRLAQLNAQILESDQDAGIIFHKESYDAEKADSKCLDNDNSSSEGCYAYVAATTDTPVPNGADDMNYCFYTDSISGTGVSNKYGAAATFGPTLADVPSDVSLRDGTLGITQSRLNIICAGLSQGYVSDEGGAGFDFGNAPKTYADSHYFSVPAPNPFDMETLFAFIFPCQHFIGEKDAITPVAIYDNEENQTTVQLGKFISPGLPTITTPGEEAGLFKLTSPYAEGWIRFGPTATNATKDNVPAGSGACNPGATCVGNSTTNTLVLDGQNTYLPGYTGAVFTQGAEALGVSHFHFNHGAGD
jgi:hypothetical protein